MKKIISTWHKNPLGMALACMLISVSGPILADSACQRCDSTEIPLEVRLANRLEDHARNIARHLEQNPSAEERFRQYLIEFQGDSPVVTYVRDGNLLRESTREVFTDGATKALYVELELGHFEDVEIFVFELLYRLETDRKCCEEFALELIEKMKLAQRMSIHNEVPPPRSCTGLFEPDPDEVVIYKRYFSYLVRFGYCRAESSILMFDGVNGWHEPSKEVMSQLCTRQLIEQSHCLGDN